MALRKNSSWQRREWKAGIAEREAERQQFEADRQRIRRERETSGESGTQSNTCYRGRIPYSC